MGDVLLTASIVEVKLEIAFGVVPRNIALTNYFRKGIPGQPASSHAFPKGRSPCAYNATASSIRNRGSISETGRRMLFATDSGMSR